MSEPGRSHGPAGDPSYEQTGFRFGWAAALAGIAIAVAIQMVLALLGLAIGFSWWTPGDVGSVGMAAGIWTIVSWIVALFVGALIAGRLAGILTRGDGALHGFVVWAGATLIAAFMLLGGIGFLAGTAFDLLGRAVASTASAAVSGVTGLATTGAAQLGGMDYESLQGELEDLLSETGRPALQPDTLEAIAERAGQGVTGEASTERVAQRIREQIEAAAGAVDRDAVVNVIAAETGMSRREAENVATRVESLAEDARREISAGLDTLGRRAEGAAGSVAAGVGSAAWWTLLTLILGAIGAAVGGAITARS